jgi:rhodanese-related sulfurtransferase
MKRLSAQAVADRLKQPLDSLILLDVRTPEEWVSDGRIEGARLIPIDEIQERALNELPKDSEIIAYCHVGVRSFAAARWLEQIGYQDIADLDGGIDAWIRAGLPVLRG